MAIIPSGSKFHTVSSSVDTVDRKSARLNSLSQAYSIEDIAETVGGGGALEGTNYIGVMATGTPVENATELRDAYETAKTMSPSFNNRITLVAFPGYYDVELTSFVMDTPFINLVSADGNRSVILKASTLSVHPIAVQADYVYVNGVDVVDNPFEVQSNISDIVIENCRGGNYSFVGYASYTSADPIICSGTFINCEAGNYSFGAWQSGTYGRTVNASGTFIDCVGGSNCFGSGWGGLSTASGTFTNCSAQYGSFGYEDFGTGSNSVASGVFKNCVSTSSYAFAGYYGTASGTFTDCEGGYHSFGDNQSSGVFKNCKAGDDSFGRGGTANGSFTDCIGGENSFGSSSFSTASGTFRGCIGGNGSFGSGGGAAASGTFIDCEAPYGSFGSYGTASGTFIRCISGGDSFGRYGTLSGYLYYCTLTFGGGTFETVSGSGKTRLCIDGNFVENNQG